MDVSNYISWLKAIKMWCMCQGLKGHQNTKSETNEKIRKLSWGLMLCYVVCNGNLVILLFIQCILIIEIIMICGHKLRLLYNNDIQHLYLVV